MRSYLIALALVLAGCGGIPPDVLLQVDRAIEGSHALAVAEDSSPAERETGWVAYDTLWSVRFAVEGGDMPPGVRERLALRAAAEEAAQAKALTDAGAR